MTEKVAVLSRDYGWRETSGGLFIMEGIKIIYQCFMIELPRFQVPYPSNTQKIDCIPGGMIYIVKKIIRPNGDHAFQVMGVPGRTAVLWHKGNFATGLKVDTEGCLLPGIQLIDTNNDGELDVKDSTVAMSNLLSLMPSEFKFHIL
jgi:hypothetical protein